MVESERSDVVFHLNELRLLKRLEHHLPALLLMSLDY